MSDNLFAFKQFTMNQNHCAIKIGTDGVLLGAISEVPETAKNILDIGSGTGLLALMLAQKSEAQIDAIEIDEPAYKQSAENFEQSKWTQKLSAIHCSLQNFKPNQQALYDLIISNPPFFRFKKNIAITVEQRSSARHDKDLPFEELAYHARRLLKPNGKFWLILPIQEGTEFIQIAQRENLFVSQQILVQPKPNKAPNRMIVCFTKTDTPVLVRTFCIYDKDGNATREYIELTMPYLLWKNNL